MAPLEIGLLAVDDVLRAGPASGERRRALVESAVAAERLGFDAWWLWTPASDEFPRRAAPGAPAVLLAAVAARTERLRLGACLALDPDVELLRVAEDAATLDGLSAGRLELGVAPCGVPEQDEEEQLRERVALLRRLWTETDVCWSGRIRGPLEHVTLEPRPVQQPHPPLWIQADDLPARAELAGELGLPLLLELRERSPARHAPLVDRYRERAARAGHTPRVGVQHAVQLSKRAQGSHRKPLDLQGDAPRIVDAILSARQALELDLHLALLDAGDLEAFAEAVMPALRAA